MIFYKKCKHIMESTFLPSSYLHPVWYCIHLPFLQSSQSKPKHQFMLVRHTSSCCLLCDTAGVPTSHLDSSTHTHKHSLSLSPGPEVAQQTALRADQCAAPKYCSCHGRKTLEHLDVVYGSPTGRALSVPAFSL